MKLVTVLLITLPYIYFVFQAVKRLLDPPMQVENLETYATKIATRATIETLIGAATLIGFIILFCII